MVYNTHIPARRKIAKHKTPEKFYEIYTVACNKVRRNHIVWSPAELAGKYGLTSIQSQELYDAISEFRNTGRKLPKPKVKIKTVNTVKNKPEIVESKITATDLIPKSNALIKTNEDILKDKLLRIREKHHDEIQKHGEQTLIKEGFIYSIINPAWPSWMKVGMTIDYESRLNSYNIYDPNCSFTIKLLRHVSDRREYEQKLLHELKNHASRVNGEWFKIDDEILTEIFYNI